MLLSLVIIIPILHLQIGIINDLLDKFYDWTDERIENITDKEREARFLRLDCEIEYDKAMKALHDFDHDQLEALRDRRKEINKIMKRKDTMKETKINLGQEKTTLATRIKILEKEKKQLRECKNERWTLFKISRDADNKLRKAKKKIEKDCRQHIEHKILAKYFIESTSYHGGKLNGVSCRRLSDPETATKIFNEIEAYLSSLDYKRCKK